MTCETQAMCIPRIQWIYTAFWLLIIVKDILHIIFPESAFFQSGAKVVKSKMAAAAILDFGIWTLTTVTFYVLDINRSCDISNKCLKRMQDVWPVYNEFSPHFDCLLLLRTSQTLIFKKAILFKMVRKWSNPRWRRPPSWILVFEHWPLQLFTYLI